MVIIMIHQEFHGTWKEIWTQKGEQEGGAGDALEYGGWNKTITPASEIAQRIVDVLKIKKTDKVLEIGCGAGGLAQFIDCDIYGIDYAKSSTKKCMKFFQIPAICAEAADLPFKDKFFDKAFAYGCFMYFCDHDYVRKSIEELKRVTKEAIFIGELPRESHEPKHLLFKEDVFKKYGFKIIQGWAEPYTEVRFSAIYENGNA